MAKILYATEKNGADEQRNSIELIRCVIEWLGFACKAQETQSVEVMCGGMELRIKAMEKEEC